MKVIFDRVNMFPVQKLNTPDRRKMSKMSNNEMSLVQLRNKQIIDTEDTVFFTGLVNK